MAYKRMLSVLTLSKTAKRTLPLWREDYPITDSLSNYLPKKTRFLGVSVQKANITDGNSCITIYVRTIKLIAL